MALQESQGKLATGLRELLEVWHNTRSQWTDANAQHLEETFLRPLQADVRQAAGGMSHMASLLTQIRHDCE